MLNFKMFKSPQKAPSKVKSHGTPLGPIERHSAESAVDVMFATRQCVSGAIVLSGRSEKFEYLPLRGETTVPLDIQFPSLVTKRKDFGLARTQVFNLKYADETEGYPSMIFQRVMEGTCRLHVMAACSYLNRNVNGPSFGEKQDQYLQLKNLVRDFIHPSYKVMTRLNSKKPYMWFHMDLRDKFTINEADAIFNGDRGTVISIPSPVIVQPQLPVEEVTLTRKPLLESDNKTITVETATGDVIKVSVDKDVMKSLSQSEIIFDDDDKSDKESNISNTITATPVEKDKPAEKTSNATKVQSEVQEEVQFTDRPESTDAIEDSGLVAIPEILKNNGYVQDVLDTSARQPAALPELNENNNEPNKLASKSRPDSSDDSDSINLDDPPYSPVECVPDPIRPGLSGLGQKIRRRKILDGTIVHSMTDEPLDKNDTRSSATRSLHAALPARLEDIPDITKEKAKFKAIVEKLRPLEEDYYAEKGMHMNLSPLISGKMLTKKVAEQEAKRIRNLMAARDAFLRTHKAKLENLQRKAERAKTSIAGRQQQRRDLEVQEYKRLSAASQKKAENVLNQANRGELVRDMPSRKQGTELSFNSSYGLQPLNKMLNRQSSQKSLFSTKVQRYVSTHGDYEDDFHEQAMSRQSSSSGSLLMQEAPISAANSFVHDEHNGTMMSAVENNLHSKEKVVKGYMRVDAFNQLQELVKANRELTASVASMKACLDNTIKEHSKRIKYNAETTNCLVESVGRMQRAFLQYDLSTNINLNEAQAEITGYLPFDELGEKVDFLLSNPATARTITKYVVTTMKPPKRGSRITVNHVVIEASNLIFTVGLRAHLSPFRQVPKDMAGRKGWYKVQNSPEFKPFMEKFLLPTAVDKSTTAKEFTRWGYNFKEHLKNAVHSYFNHHCGEHDNQGEWVEKRWELRKMLLHKHMIGTDEEKAAAEISCEAELMNYVADSKYKSLAALFNTKPSQEFQKELKEPKGRPMPSMDVLKSKAANLQELIDAAVVITKESKDSTHLLREKKPASSTITSADLVDDDDDGKEYKPADTSEDFVSDDDTAFNFDKTLNVTPGNTSVQALWNTPVRHPASQQPRGVKRPFAHFSSTPHKIWKAPRRTQ